MHWKKMKHGPLKTFRVGEGREKHVGLPAVYGKGSNYFQQLVLELDALKATFQI